MNKEYKPQWFKSPFDHLKYTLVRDLDQCKKIKIDKELISLPHGANATTNFLSDEYGGNIEIVVYLPYSGVDLLMQQGLIVHESVHIWQEIKTMMGEKEPSIEFEAYSIQRIAQDLLYLLDLSNDMEKPTD